MFDHPHSDPPPGRKRLRQLLELFQPGKDSWAEAPFSAAAQWLRHDPELQREWQTIESQDRQIRTVLRQTPVPEGLLERTLARLASAHIEKTPSAATDERCGVGNFPRSELSKVGEQTFGACPGEDAHYPPGKFLSPSRGEKPNGLSPPLVGEPEPCTKNKLASLGSVLARRVLGALVALSLLFCLAWPSYSLWRSPRQGTWSSSSLLEQAIAHFRSDRSYYGQGRPLSELAPPLGFRPSAHVYGWQQSRWRTTELIPARTTVAFDLPSLAGVTATLYVVDVQVPGLPDLPPLFPSLNTGMCSAGIWRENGRVCILVVAGGPDSYRRFLLEGKREVA
jgi:hypothetical protein